MTAALCRLTLVILLLAPVSGVARGDTFLDYLDVKPMEEEGRENDRPVAQTETATDAGDAPVTPPPPPNKAPNVPLPEGWEPATSNIAPRDADATAPGPAEPVRPVGPRIPVAPDPLAPASAWTVRTPWGNIPFSAQGAYQYENSRGPAFTIKAPVEWSIAEGPHEILGGMQHRYSAPDGMTTVVIVTFAMDEETDLSRFLAARQARLLSSFKLQQARQISLGRRAGLGVFYQGILMMRDAACHLFLTRYKGKGYLVYGYYFNEAGGRQVANVMQSLRIY